MHVDESEGNYAVNVRDLFGYKEDNCITTLLDTNVRDEEVETRKIPTEKSTIFFLPDDVLQFCLRFLSNRDLIHFDCCMTSFHYRESWLKVLRSIICPNFKCINVIQGHRMGVRCFVPLKDGRYASGSDDGNIKLWDMDSYSCEKTLSSHYTTVVNICQLSDGRLVSGSYDNTVKIWDIGKGKCKRSFDDEGTSIRALISLPKNRIMTGTFQGRRLWKMEGQITSSTLDELVQVQHILSLLLLHDGRIASGTMEGVITIWDAKTAKIIEKQLEKHDNGVNCMIQLPFHNENHRNLLISGSSDHTIRIWDILSGFCMKILSGHSTSVTCLVALDDHFNRIMSGSFDQVLKIWNIETGECERSFQDEIVRNNFEIRGTLCLTQLPDGRIVSGSYDRLIRIWSPTY